MVALAYAVPVKTFPFIACRHKHGNINVSTRTTIRTLITRDTRLQYVMGGNSVPGKGLECWLFKHLEKERSGKWVQSLARP
jgi:hypothetical protein